MDIRVLPLPPMGANCYLLIDPPSGQLAVIDPGSDPTPTLLRLCVDNGWTVSHIFLTHGHYDHMGGASALRRTFPDAPIHLHPADAGLDEPLTPTASLGNVTLWADGDRVSVGGLTVEVLHTPGHTAGSVTLRCEDVLFTGDTLFAGTVGRTDLPGGDAAAMMASLKRLAQLPGDLRVLPGHNEATTLDAERRRNPYLREAMGR